MISALAEIRGGFGDAIYLLASQCGTARVVGMGLSSHKAQFYHQLTTLLEAGIGVQTATEHLRTQRHQRLSAFASALAYGTANGLTLAESLETAPKKQVDALETSLLSAAERGGKIELATRQLSEHYELQAQLWQQILRAMIYPIIVLHAAIVLPSVGVFVGGGGTIWEAIGKPLLIAYALVAAVWLGGRWLWEQGQWSDSIDSLLNRIPGLGSWRKSLSLARFCQALGIQLQAGENVAKAVASAGKASATANLKHATKAMAQTISQEGCPLGPLLLMSNHFNPDLAQILSTSETAGRLELESLERARKLMDTARNSAATTGMWVPKLLYAPIALYAVWRIFSFYRDYIGNLTKGLDL
jgi:type IV pilus assembly protein PilC